MEGDLERFTNLYWNFLKTHKNKLADNPRMAIMFKRVN